jgi:hypothetical protein
VGLRHVPIMVGVLVALGILGIVVAVSGNDSVDGAEGTDKCTADAGDTVVNCP